MTPDAVIYRYLQIVTPPNCDIELLCLLLSTDADLLARWLKLLDMEVDLQLLRERVIRINPREFAGLAQSQATAVLPVAGSARLGLDQWLSVLRAACLAEVLAAHFAQESADSAEQPAQDSFINTRLRALLGISGVHVRKDPMLSALVEYRGINPALLEDAALELRIFAVVDALEVGREVELAQQLLGLTREDFTAYLEEAEAASNRLVQQLSIDLHSEVDWANRIWLRQQIGIVAAGFGQTSSPQEFHVLHQLVSRCLFARPPLLLTQLNADGPLVFLDEPEIAINLDNRTSMLAACVRNARSLHIVEALDLAVVDRQLLRRLNCEEAYAVPLTIDSPMALMLVAADEDIDIETAADLYAEEVGEYLSGYARQTDQGQADQSALVEEFRAGEYKRLREIVHEANNPLSIVHNYLHILELRLQHEPEVVEQLELIAAELRRAGEIFTRARDVPDQVNADEEVTGEVSEIEVGAWIARLAELHSGYAAEHGVALNTSLPAQTVMLETEPDKLTQIISNLVQNAIEACSSGDEVCIGARGGIVRDGRLGAEFFVEDTGTGLSTEVLQNLTAAKRTTKGGDHQGVGLQIAFKLTAELDGALDVRTEPGQGTMFSLFLPFPR